MDRKQALDQLRIMQAWHEDFGNGPNADYDAICYAINIIEEMPEGMDTLIKALEQEHKKLREMQKALPEIIYCKDCKYSEYHKLYGDRFCQYNNVVSVVPDLHYCGYAERRTDERSD